VSRSLGPHLPDTLVSRLTATDPVDRFGSAVVLATSDPYGWPHPALVSYAELLVLDATRLRLGLHSGTRSAVHLRDAGRGTLIFTDADLALYVKIDGVPLPDARQAGRLSRFELHVRDVLEDRGEADERGARLGGGIRFEWPRGLEAWVRHAARMREALEA